MSVVVRMHLIDFPESRGMFIRDNHHVTMTMEQHVQAMMT